MKDWRPRWYYIMRNVTTGMLYVGQTYNLTTRSYCGSGKYWVTHCKKHGGYSRKNIEIVEKFWAEDETQAHQWLDAFEANNPDYFVCSNSAWANRARETTGNSAFCGVSKEKRVEYARAGGLAMARAHPDVLARVGAKQGKINAESGHMQRIQKIGCVLGGKIVGPILGRRMVESGHMDRICRLGGAEVSAMRHAEKDSATGQSLFAVKLGKASGVTRGLMKQFCKEHGIDSPGVNFVNMDKSAFKQWRVKHAG